LSFASCDKSSACLVLRHIYTHMVPRLFVETAFVPNTLFLYYISFVEHYGLALIKEYYVFQNALMFHSRKSLARITSLTCHTRLNSNAILS